MRRLVIALAVLLPLPALAAIHVEHAWSPPSLSQPNAVGFMDITSDTDDTLLSATSDCCTVVELHTHQMDGDVIRMRRVENIPLPAGKKVQLRPGGYHLMLITLHKPLTDGMTTTVTLKFAHAPDQKVVLAVDRARLLERIKSPRD